MTAVVQDRVMEVLDKNHRKPFPGCEALAFIANLDTEQVARAVTELKRIGWLTYEQNSTMGKFRNIKAVPADERPPRPERQGPYANSKLTLLANEVAELKQQVQWLLDYVTQGIAERNGHVEVTRPSV